MENEIFSLLRRLDSDVTGLSGVVRLTTTTGLASHLFAPAMRPFLERHPGLQVELVGDSQSLDLSRREADIAVRMAKPTASSLVTRPLHDLAFAFYAAVDDPRSFSDQLFLGYEELSAHETPRSYLEGVVPAGRIMLRTNATQTLIEAVRSGVGCAVLPCLIGERDSALRRVSAPRPMQPMTLWLIYHEELRRSPRVRETIKFIDAVVEANSDFLVPKGFPFDA